jgi:predicted dehydrogenase
VIEPRLSARVALVGYGFGGSVFHAPFIDAAPRLDLVAVVTANRDRQAAVRARYVDTAVLSSVDELLGRIDEVDLVVISTPNASHVPIAERVVVTGRHVVIDKPVAPSPDQVRHLASLAGPSGAMVIPFHNRRWDGDFLTVRKILEFGELGDIFAFESRFERWRPVRPTGSRRAWTEDPLADASGILYDLGPHLIDQAIVLFGRPEAVYAELSIRRPEAQVDDDVFLALIYPDRPSVHLWASAAAADRGPRFRLLGTEGAFVKYGMDVQEEALVAGASPRSPAWGVESPESWGAIVVGADRRTYATEPGAYQQFYAGVAASLLDRTPPPVDVTAAVDVAEVISTARRSAATRSICLLR